MKTQHWIGAVVLVIVGIVIGVKFPNLAAKIPGLGS